MPAVRHNPSQRVHDRASLPDATLQHTPEASPFAQSSSALPNSSQKQRSSLVWNGKPVTPAAHFLLLHGTDSSLFQDFSSIHVHDSSLIFDPSSSLPLPPRPGASPAHSSVSALLSQAGSAPLDPSSLSSSSPSAISPPAPQSPTSKPHPHPLPSLPAPADASTIIYTRQPPSQPARPPNHFLLFRADYFARVKSLHLPSAHYASLPKDHAQWEQAPETVKTYYRELARLTKEVHGRLHPGYKYKPRTKEERQRQKDEKLKLKQETMAAARAKKTTKSRTKSLKVAATIVVPSPGYPPSPPTASVDVRMYNPTHRTYHHPSPSDVQGPLPPSPPQASHPSSSPASTPSPPFSGVPNVAHRRGIGYRSFDSSPHTTSPTYTLFQVDEGGSPRFDDAYCTTSDNANGLHPTWPTIEEGVDWYQAAPPHWCGPDVHLPFCDEGDCDNCVAMSWSDELNIDIQTPSSTSMHPDAVQYTSTPPSYSFAPHPPHPDTHPRPSISLENVQFASNHIEALLASTMEVNQGGEADAFWNGLFEPAQNLPPTYYNYLTPEGIYVGHV